MVCALGTICDGASLSIRTALLSHSTVRALSTPNAVSESVKRNSSFPISALDLRSEALAELLSGSINVRMRMVRVDEAGIEFNLIDT